MYGTARAPSSTSCATGSSRQRHGRSRSPSSSTLTETLTFSGFGSAGGAPEVEDYAPVVDPTTPEPSRWRRRPTGSTSNCDLGGRPCRRLPRAPTSMPEWAGAWYELRSSTPPTRTCCEAENGLLDGSRRRCTVPTIPAASTCTSAASSTRCCTCCTRGSGTRCCSTWATSLHEPYRRLYNQGSSRPSPTRDARRRATCPPTRSEEKDGKYFYDGAEVNRRVRQDGQEPEELRHPGRDGRGIRGRHVPAVRDVDGPARRRRVPWTTEDVVGAAPVPAARRGGWSSTRRPVPCALPTTPRERRPACPEQGDRTGSARIYTALLVQHGGRQADRVTQPRDQGVSRRLHGAIAARPLRA